MREHRLTANRTVSSSVFLRVALLRIALLLIVLMIAAPVSALTSTSKVTAPSPKIVVEGVEVTFSADTGIPFVDANGRTQVPLRKVLETYGAKVAWQSKSQRIDIAFGNQTIALTIGSNRIASAQGDVTMDTVPMLKNGKVYLPIQPVIKTLSGYVNWRPDLKVVALTSNPEAMPLVKWVFSSDGNHPWEGKQIVVRLNEAAAPITVANFLALVQKGFYEKTPIHRIASVNSAIVIQGGDPTGTGAGGPGTTIVGEFKANKIDNPIKHLTGVLSMARSSSYNSAGSQYFICVGDNPFLDGQYAAFGEVIEGMDVFLSIAKLTVTEKNRPIENLWISDVARIEDLSGNAKK